MFPAGLARVLSFTDTRALEPSSPTDVRACWGLQLPDLPNQQSWPLWLSAIVTWRHAHPLKAEPFTSLTQFTYFLGL